MKNVLTYCSLCIGVAFKGSIGSAANWGWAVAAGLIGYLLDQTGMRLSFPAGPTGDVVAFFVYFFLAWITIFAIRMLFIAPYKLWQQNNRPRIRIRLQEFYAEIGILAQKVAKKGITEEILEQQVAEIDAKLNEVVDWITSNLGEPAAQRFVDKSDMVSMHYVGTLNEAHNNVIMNLNQFKKNLTRMIESDSWT